jgi:hypothetical protein
MRHALALQSSIFDGSTDVELVAHALRDAEVWIPPLSPTGQKLYVRLLASVERQDGAIMQRIRRNPMATANLFALLPAPEAMRLFGHVERYDENWLADVERTVLPGSVLAALVDGRAGFLRAVFALTRIIHTMREVVRATPMSM